MEFQYLPFQDFGGLIILLVMAYIFYILAKHLSLKFEYLDRITIMKKVFLDRIAVKHKIDIDKEILAYREKRKKDRKIFDDDINDQVYDMAFRKTTNAKPGPKPSKK